VILGRVIGQCWATRQASRLDGQKLLLVQPLAWYDPDHQADHLVCVDPVGAEVGQDVVVCMGLPARLAAGDTRTPVEASIAAIVDGVELYPDTAEGPAFAFAPGRAPETLRQNPGAST
jgi:ethanolamine utilization protein EutN